MRECWEPWSSNLLITPGSGESKSVCARPAGATVNARRSKAASVIVLIIVRGLMSGRILPEDSRNAMLGRRVGYTSPAAHIKVKDLGNCKEGFRTTGSHTVVTLLLRMHL